MEGFLVELGLSPAWAASLQLELLGRLLLAAVLGGVVGFEREVSGKPAGLRTNLLICVGSALFTELSVEITRFTAVSGPGPRPDPGRIAAQIVTGIGFLGAGTILRSHGRITGLTTAATLGVVAAVGVAVGARAYAAAVGTTALVMFSLSLLGRMERYVSPRRRISRRYAIEVAPDPELLAGVEQEFRAEGMSVRIVALQKRPECFQATLSVTGPALGQERVADSLLRHPGVNALKRNG
ncbi:MAG: MgtC/SapB family protein [Gemmatimonadota bacterium]